MKSPTSLLKRYLHGISQNNIDELSSIFHENAVMEFPYALRGLNDKINGLESILAYFQKIPFTWKLKKDCKIEIHFNKQDHIVAEYEGIESFKRTGRVYNQQYVCLLKVKDGKIIHFKEYFNPITRFEGMLGLEEYGDIMFIE